MLLFQLYVEALLFLLISFTVDVAVRAVKLSFLQLITPVAVIGYIEPGGGILRNG